MPADGVTLGRMLCTIFGQQLLAIKVCCVRESQLGNSVDPYAMAISFMLTVTLLWQYRLLYRLKIFDCYQGLKKGASCVQKAN